MVMGNFSSKFTFVSASYFLSILSSFSILKAWSDYLTYEFKLFSSAVGLNYDVKKNLV